MSSPQRDGFACDDDDAVACTRNDVCIAGACRSGTAVSCPMGASCRDGACVAPRCTGELGFPGPAPIGVHTHPVFILSSDLDGDGTPDLVTANQTSDDISVLLGRGRGGFAPPVQVATGEEPLALAAGDFNGDGDVDLLVANSESDEIALLLGEGDGTIALSQLLPTGPLPWSLAVADLDGDLDDDFVAANAGDLAVSGSAQVVVHRNDGDGAFTTSTITLDASARNLELVDMDGDGIADVVYGRAPLLEMRRYVDVLHNRGDGTFDAPIQNLVGGSGEFNIVTADVDDDGDRDVVFSGQSFGSIHFLLNDGSGRVAQSSTYYALPYALATNSLKTADLNRDGLVDVIAGIYENGHTTRTLNVLLSRGGGQFERLIQYPFGYRGRHLAVADVNGDGALDVAGVDDGGDAVRVLLNAGDGRMIAGFSLGSPFQVEAVELDGDGHVDIVTLDFGRHLIARRNLGDGSFGPAVAAPAGIDGSLLAIADFDGDGLDDVVITDTDNAALGISYNTGGAFAAAVEHPIGIEPSALAAGDVDRDGRADIVVADERAAGRVLTVMHNRGDGTFANAAQYDAGQADALVAADVSGDGWLDLLAAGGSAYVRVLLNERDGTFAPAVHYPVVAGAREIAIADLDGDGALDVVTPAANGVSVLLNRGNGVFDPQNAYGAGGNATSVDVADFDGDGDIDLVVTLTDDDSIGVLLNGGAGTFLTPLVYPSAGNADHVATADFDGDGRPDAIVSGQGGDFSGSLHLSGCL